MKYLGSKNRIAKELAPIISSYITSETKVYIEPFVGGANMIDKIVFNRKVGSDVNPYLVALLRYVSDLSNVLPTTITEEEYNAVKRNFNDYTDWYVGLVGFCATFSAKFFGGYARAYKNDGITIRDMPGEAIRNIEKQRYNLVGIDFTTKPFEDYSAVKDAVIYCDPPYRDTTKYKTDAIDYDAFYEWCTELALNNTVLISEYNMPADRFDCIWKKEHSVNLHSKRNAKSTRVERLYIAKPKEATV